MKEQDILSLWKSYDEKLSEQLIINRHLSTEVTQLKIESLLTSMRPIKVFTIAVGVLWVLAVDVVIFNSFTVASPFFIVSAFIQVLLTKLAIGIYIYQLVLLDRLDVSTSIVDMQRRIASLRISTLWLPRILLLQLPVWTTFYLTWEMLSHADPGWLVLQFATTFGFLYAALWLFINIRIENRDKRWFRVLFSGKEWTPLMKAGEMMEEISAIQGS